MSNKLPKTENGKWICEKPNPTKCPKWHRLKRGCPDCNMIWRNPELNYNSSKPATKEAKLNT